MNKYNKKIMICIIRDPNLYISNWELIYPRLKSKWKLMLIISKLVLDPEWIRMIYGNYYDFFVIYIRSNQNSICAQVERRASSTIDTPPLTHPPTTTLRIKYGFPPRLSSFCSISTTSPPPSLPNLPSTFRINC
jgi:hypothetical protein